MDAAIWCYKSVTTVSHKQHWGKYWGKTSTKRVLGKMYIYNCNYFYNYFYNFYNWAVMDQVDINNSALTWTVSQNRNVKKTNKKRRKKRRNVKTVDNYFQKVHEWRWLKNCFELFYYHFALLHVFLSDYFSYYYIAPIFLYFSGVYAVLHISDKQTKLFILFVQLK